MRKPSIFSRDYERIMRRRKRIFVTSISLIIISVVLTVTFISRYKFTNIESYLTTWIKDKENTKRYY